MQTMSQGDGSDDKLVFANLATVLDDGEAANLLRLRNADPRLTYASYWKSLCSEKERFHSQSFKQALESLRLESKGKLTLSRCKEYTANFQRIFSQTPHVSREEAIRLILRQIPFYLAQKLQTEISKKRDPLKACVSGVHSLSPQAFQDTLTQALGFSSKWVGIEGENFIVEAFSHDQQRSLLALNGSTVQGHGTLNITPIESGFSVTQCMEFLLSTIQLEEELEDTRRVFLSSQTHAVDVPNATPKYDNSRTEPFSKPTVATPSFPSPPQTDSGKGKGKGKGKGQAKGFGRGTGRVASRESVHEVSETDPPIDCDPSQSQ